MIAEALVGIHERYESWYAGGEHIATLVARSISAAGTQHVLDAVQRVAADRLPSLAKLVGWLDGDAVRRALTRLLGADVVRAQVVEALVRHGAGVVTLLIEQLRAEDLETRQAAAVALGRIGDRRARGPLVAALQDPELAVVAAGALARIGDRDAFDALLPLLGSPDLATRQAAVAALNSIGHPDMPRQIANLIDSPDPLVRESALKIAGYFGYANCVEQVLRCCRDEDEAVRRAALDGLSSFDDPRALPLLFNALERESPTLRAVAAAALSRVPTEAAIDALARALRDPDPWVRYAALRSLGTLADERMSPAVLRLLHDDPAPQVRLAAVEAIGRLRPPEALAQLRALVQLEPELLERALHVIERNAAAQARMIDDMLDVARISAGKLRLEMQPVDLLGVLLAAIDVIMPAAQAKRVSLRTSLDPATPQVLGDPDRLQQVTWNLLSNALKFTDAGGTVEVRLESSFKAARIVVADSGCGIAPEFLPFVFERFRQADTSSGRRHGGLGLGLALVRDLVALHGGTVRAESAGAGKGATFTIELPAVLSPEIRRNHLGSEGMPADAISSLTGVRVLVVDDETDARELAVTTLQHCGATVRAVSSGAEALDVLLSSQTNGLPDVIVSDIGMPHEDGYQVIRRLRAMPSAHATPRSPSPGTQRRRTSNACSPPAFSDTSRSQSTRRRW